MKRSDAPEKQSISNKLWSLSLALAVPLCLMSIALFLLFLFYSNRYEKVTSNITTVSTFNQNFKDEVDLAMYHYVTGNAPDVPLEEVEQAKSLAETLMEGTTNKESRRAIQSVLNLSENLSACISEIVYTDGYDQRMTQLENNVYVITELIQKYMYTYLYHEAGELADLRQKTNVWRTVTIFSILALMLAIVYLSVRQVLRVSKSITQPIDKLYERVEEIGRGDLTAKEPVPAHDDKLQALSDSLEEMVSKLSDQIELNRREQIRLRSMELSLLQAQINPHFLYNTLDAIIWLVETGKNDDAVEMVSSLSTYFRSFLSNGKEIIPLSEEIQHVKSYLEIQQYRYKDILSYNIDVSPATDGCSIPKMTLQPLVENAIYHGIKPKRGIGTVHVKGCMEGDDVIVTVSDTGAGMPPETLAHILSSLDSNDAPGFGVFAVWQRLKLTYGDSFRFDIESEPDVGTTVRIRIPYTPVAEESQ